PIVFVMPQHAIELLELSTSIFTTMATGLEPRLIKMIESFKKIEPSSPFAELSRENIVEVANDLNKSDETVRRWLKDCVDAGWMQEKQSSISKTQNTFTLKFSLNEIQTKIGAMNFDERRKEVLLKQFKEEATAWLKEVLPKLRERDGMIRGDILKWFM
ncbi:hypothetical protein MUP77_24755, partial [Candidatus Bathyarchaeota archaeon]|nr:hypothetical protein [Candidatus Bathyarchaeota archaeon]